MASSEITAAGIVEEALRSARKELAVLHGCLAQPGGAEYGWKVNTSEAVGKIDQALFVINQWKGRSITPEETAELKELLKAFVRRVSNWEERQSRPEEVEILPDVIELLISL